MKKILPLIFILFKVIFPSFGQTQTQNPIAYYPFNGDAKDVSSNNYHATVNGAILTTDRFNHPNRAYYFDGIDDNIVLPSSFDLLPKSISFWFTAHTIDANSRILYVSDNPNLTYGLTAIELKTIKGIPHLITHITSSRDTVKVSTNTWYQFAITVNTDSTHFYLNEFKLKSRERTSYPKSNTGEPQTFLGSHRQGNTNSRYFHGKIDNVMIYNKELTRLELLASYINTTSLNLGPDECIKQRHVVKLHAQGFAKYLWSDGSTGATLDVFKAGKYSLTATDYNGINHFDEINISDCPQPDFTYTFDCKSNSFTFAPILNFANDRFHWKYDGHITPNVPTLVHQFKNEGVNQVSLNVYISGKEYTIDKFITYTKSVTPYLGRDTVLCTGKSLLLKPETLKGTTLKWSTGTTGTSLAVTSPGTYWVEATRGDCTIRDEIVVNYSTCQEEIKQEVFIPNIFTPNGDGQNDFFLIQNLNLSAKNQLAVYNRWGQQVFYSSDYKNEWNGAKQEGVFFYVLTLGEKGKVYKGWVEVLR